MITKLWTQEHLHNKYNRYAALFYTCETSNLLIVISQILVINKFLNYQFLSYGFNVSLDVQISVLMLFINIYIFRFGPGTLCRQRRELCRIWIRCVRCSQGLPAVTMSGDHRQLPSSKTSKCILFRFGAGGHQERKNALCILGLNMINDKIFLVIWWLSLLEISRNDCL